jgi:hypothetical protein
VGLGDRGIAELAFLLTWLVNWITTLIVGCFLTGFTMFIFSWVKDSVLSLLMLYVLFGAFQGKQSAASLRQLFAA